MRKFRSPNAKIQQWWMERIQISPSNGPDFPHGPTPKKHTRLSHHHH